jgi:hypothetical protein
VSDLIYGRQNSSRLDDCLQLLQREVADTNAPSGEGYMNMKSLLIEILLGQSIVLDPLKLLPSGLNVRSK